MIEKILRFSIHYRVLVLLVTLGISAYGLYILPTLPIDAVPDVTNNQVQINTSIDNLSPGEMEKQVTFFIENALSGIPGLESTRSLSRNGFSQVTAVFEDKVNVHFARQQIAERLSEIRESLPPGSEPRMGPLSTGLGEVYMWTVKFDHSEPAGISTHASGYAIDTPGWKADGSFLTPDGKRLTNAIERGAYLRTVQDWIVKPQLKGIQGLAGIDSIGGYVMQIHVHPDLDKLMSFGLSLKDLKEALEHNNLNRGAGIIEVQGEAYLMKTDARIQSLEELENVVIASNAGMPIYLKDLAKIEIGKEWRSGSSSQDGEEIVTGTAMMLMGGNSRTVANAVDRKMDEIKSQLPPGIRIETVLNRTKLIDSTIHTVVKNLSEGALLVIAVLFALMGNFRAACITALVIPIAMLLTAVGMIKSHISGNLMSLGAIDFGLIVDGAVILAENSLRRLSEKQAQLGRILNADERVHEVVSASTEMIRPSVFGQAIIIMVYIPLLSLSGIEGKMFEPMALTVIFALLAAFVLSLTFVPAMIALWVTNRVHEGDNSIIKKAKDCYRPILKTALTFPARTIGMAAACFVMALFLFMTLGQEFVPTLDEQDLAVQSTRSPSTSLSQATQMQLEVEKTLLKFPEVAKVFSKTGTAEMASDPMPPDASDTFVIFKPKEEWPQPIREKEEIIEQMEAALKRLPGNNFEFTQPIEMRFNELIAGVQSDVAIKIYGDDFEVLQKTAHRIAEVVRKVPGAADVMVDKLDGLPTIQVDVDRLSVSSYGLDMQDVLDVVGTAFGGEKTGVIFSGDRRVDIVLILDDALRQNLNGLENIPIPLPKKEGLTGQFITLKEVASIKEVDGLNEVGRENGKRVLMVTTNVRGTDLGTFIEHAKKAIKQKVHIPSGYWIAWGGQYESLLSAQERLLVVVPVCFFLIFTALYAAFNSGREALTVFSGVPFALTGGVLSLGVRAMPFSISAAVGFIAVSGIAVLNGLVLMTAINALRKQGIPLKEALFEGALTRLRPVLMTALVASLGFLPMALATGAGAEVQKPLATVVVGGLISSTLLTLVVLPCIYLLLVRTRKTEELVIH